MRTRIRLNVLLLCIFLVSGTAVRAEITAHEAWARFVEACDLLGLSVTHGNQEAGPGNLTLREVKIRHFVMPKDADITFSEITLNETDDGRVEIAVLGTDNLKFYTPPDSFDIPPNLEGPTSLPEFRDGFLLIASSEGGKVDFSFASKDFFIPEELGSSANVTDMFGKLTLDVWQDPDEESGIGRLAVLEVRTADAHLTVAPADVAGNGDLGYTVIAERVLFRVLAVYPKYPEQDGKVIDFGIGAALAGVLARREGLSSDPSTLGVRFRKFFLGGRSDRDESFKALVDVQAEATHSLWDAIDPGGSIKRSPVTLYVDVSGSGGFRRNPAFEGNSGEASPIIGLPETIDIQRIQIGAFGTDFLATGGFRISQQFRPLGTASLKLTGVKAAGDTLAWLMSFRGGDSAQARSVLEVFVREYTRAEGVDTVTTSIAVNNDGIYANGKPLE